MPRLRNLALFSLIGVAALVCLYVYIDRIVAIVLGSVAFIFAFVVVVKKYAPRSPYDLRIEQDGKILIFLTVGLGFAALNTGSNLLYLILGILLSLIIVSGLLSQRVLMYLRISRTFPGLVRAETPIIYKTTAQNRKRWFPSYHLVLSNNAAHIANQTHTFIPFVAPDNSSEVFSSITFRRRGLIGLDTLNDELATRFPFGFFTKKKRLKLSGKVLVLPASVSLEALPASLSGRLNESYAQQPEEDNFLGLRPFEPGDDFRRIQWKRSTIGDELIVKQTDTSQGEDLHLWLFRSSESIPFSDHEEYWISVAATVVEHTHRLGRNIHLHLGDQSHTLPSNASSPEMLWRELALLDTADLPTQVNEAQPEDCLLDVCMPTPETQPTETDA